MCIKFYVLLAFLSAIVIAEDKFFGLKAKSIGTEGFFDVFPQECGMNRFEKLSLLPTVHHKANLGQFPWMAKIAIHPPTTIMPIFYCTGVLIHKRFVLTVAHCGNHGSMVRLGENDISTREDCDECDDCAPPPQDIPIIDILFSKYCRLSKVDDVALILLGKSVDFNSYVQPICLPEKAIPHKLLLNLRVTVAGWGKTYSGFGKVNTNEFMLLKELKYAYPSILPTSRCDGHQRPVRYNEYCVGYQEKVSFSSRDPCVADSGSPLMKQFDHRGKHRYVLLGLASHELECDKSTRTPAVYFDISAHLSDIRLWMEVLLTAYVYNFSYVKEKHTDEDRPKQMKLLLHNAEIY